MSSRRTESGKSASSSSSYDSEFTKNEDETEQDSSTEDMSSEEDIEEEEEEEEEDAENDRLVDEMIKVIERTGEEEFLSFTSTNESLLLIIKETNRIRQNCKPDNYKKLSDETTAFTENEDMIKAFENLRQQCLFVMQIHKQYGVPLVPKKPETKHIDSVLDTIRNVLSKYTNHFPNVQMNTLTIPTQSTTVK
jgi:hypothetical protein